MKHLNFLSKRQSCSHNVVTLAATVGSPLAHRRSTMLKLLSVLVLVLTFGVGNVWGAVYTLGWGTASGTVGTFSNFTANNGSVTNVVSFSCTQGSAQSAAAYNSGSQELRMYYKNNGNGNSLTLTPASGVTISQVVITASSASYAVSSTYSVDGGNAEDVSWSSTTSTITGLSCTSSFTIKNTSTSSQLRIKKIEITYTVASSCDHLTMSTVTATPGNTRIDLSWPAVTNASSYTVTCKKKSDNSTTGISIGSVSGSGPKTCAITGLTNGVEYTWSVMPVGDGSSYCEDNTPATGDATPNQTRTITYYDKDGQHTTTLTEGANIANALNALYGVGGPTSCDTEDYEYFVGWKDGSINGTASSVTLLSTEVVNATTATKTYYAVWSDTEPADYSTTYSSNVSGVTGVNVSIGGSTYGAKKLGSSGSGGSFSVTAPSGTTKLYLHAQGWNNKSATLTLSTNVGSISPTEAQSLTANAAISGSVTTFTLTTLTNDFFEYSLSNITSDATITIATQSERGVIWGVNAVSSSGDANYITSCCTKLGQINGSFYETHPTSVVLKWDKNANYENWAVTGSGTIGNVQTTTISSVDYWTCEVTELSCNTEYEFTVTADPVENSGYCDGSWKISGTTSKFSIEKANSGTVKDGENNTIGTFAVTGNLTEACNTTAISLTYEVTNAGYQFKAWNVHKKNDASTKVTVTNNQFYMPAYDVVVDLELEEISNPTLTPSVDAVNFGNQEISTTSSAQTISISGANLQGGVAFEITGTDASAFAVTSPASSPIAQANAEAVGGQSVQITFTPSGAKVHSATLRFTSTNATTRDVTLSGTGVNLYTVTFDKGTGVCETSSAKQASFEASVTLPDATPSTACAAEDWEFAGWSETNVTTETETAPTILEGDTYTPTENKTLYAVYSRMAGEPAAFNNAAGQYRIYANVSGAKYYATGTVNSSKKIASTTDVDQATIYTFEKIEENANVYYAIKTGDDYITYANNSNSKTDLGTSASSYKWTISTQNVNGTFRVASQVSGRGLIFQSFNTNSQSTKTFAGYATSNVTENSTDYYDLEIESTGSLVYHKSPSCTGKAILTYDANGGENAPDAEEYDIDDDPVVAGVGSMVKTGHEFTGWNTKANGQGTSYAAGATITDIKKDMTLYAQWSKLSYTVKVTDPGNGNEITAPENDASVEYDAKVTLTSNAAEHWSFTSWTVTKDGDAGTVVDLTDEGEGVYSFNMPDYDVAISATFTEDDKVKVTWHVNYGTSETANIYVNTPFSQLNAPAVADNAVSTCANKFMGWATAVVSKDNATSEDVSWADETNVSSTNKDFYAVWATGSASSTSFVKLGENEASYLVQGAKIAIVNNKNDKILGSDFAETAATHPDDDDNKLTVSATQIWNLAEQNESGYWKLTCGNVQLGTNNVASSGGSSEDIGSYTNDYSWWGLSSNTNWTNKVSGCYYMFNWYNNTYYNFLEYNGSKWVSYYATDVTSGNKSYYAMKLYKPATDYSNYITNCCLPVENALTITNANQVATGSQLTLSTTGGNGGEVVWSVVAGTGTATISEGKLTGGELGTVTLKAHQAEYNNYCAQDAEDMTVTIVAATVPVTSISLNHTTAALLPGETIQLNATLTPGNATDQTIGWVSGTPAKATVSNAGLVTAVAKGTSTVTVTANGGENITDNCAVTVYDLTIELQDQTGATISAEGVTATATGKSLSASAGETQYVFKGWKYAENGNGGLDAIVNASNTSITLTGTPTGDVTIIAEFYKPVTITWLVDGEPASAGSQTLSVARGTLWSALTPAAEPEGDALGSCATAFVGWSNSMNDELRGTGNAEPELLVRNSQFSSYDTEITEPITFRAVFATSAQGSTFDGTAGGQFYIYANVGGTYHYAKAAVTSNKLESTTSVAEAALFTFTKHATEANKFTISIGDNYYAKGSGNTDLKTQAAAYWWTLSEATYGSWHLESETGGRGFMYQDYQTVSQVTSYTRKFGCYSTNNADGDDYFDVEIAGAASYTNYVTVCCTPHSVTVNGNDESENKTVSADVEETCDGMTVNLSRNTSCTHYTFNEWVITYTDGEGEHTIHVAEDENHSGSFTMPAAAVTVEGDWSPVNYKVTIASAANGSATVKEDYATDEQGRWLVPYGSTVTLQATPSDAEAYYFTGWTLSPDKDVQKSLAELPITMTGSFTATPSFAQIVESALTLGSAEGVYSLSATLANGDPITNMKKIKSGTELKVTYELSGQNEFVGWTFSVNSVEKTAEGTTVTFNMPEEDLNVSLNTRPYYLLDLSAEHGSITSVSIAGEAQEGEAPYIVHEGEVVALTAAPADDTYKFKEWTGATVTNNQFTVGTEDLNVKAVFEPKSRYTLTLMALGREQEKIENILEGESIWEQIDGKEAPEITGQLFMGWSLEENEASMIISENEDFDINDDYPLYAIYQAMTPCYVKVTSTSDIKNGKYLIVYEGTEGNGLAFNGGLETLDDSRNTIAVTISNNTIAISEATTAAEFTITATENGYSIKSASDYYIGQTGNSNGLASSTSVVYDNTIGFSDGDADIVSEGAYMRYNSASNQQRFRYYKSSTYTAQNAIQLYKRGGVPNPSGETASIPTVTITTPVNADEIYPDGKAGNIVIEDGGSININTEVDLNNITVKDGATVTVNEELVANDMIVENGGTVVITEDKNLDVKDFYIGGTHGKSGQVTNAKDLDINGNAYFDFTLGVDVSTQEGAEKAANQWHNFSVPFPVDAMSGVYGYKEGEWKKLTNEVDYAIEDYKGDLRAQGKYGWKKYRGIMTPGTTYSMTVNGDIQTYRFKKSGNDAFAEAPTVEFSQHSSSDPMNAGWNGLGNMRLCYSSISNSSIAETTPQGKSAGRYVLVLDAESYTYQPYALTEINLTVGSAFFIQASADGEMGFNEAQGGADKIYAPARNRKQIDEPIAVTLSNETSSDRMYITASEDALNEYQIGRDLQKMIATATPKAPMIYSVNYGGIKLAAEEAPIVDNKAVYDLKLYAPANGQYTVSAPSMENVDLYLTQNGSIIWNLSMSAYELELTKGTTEGYGLLLQAKAPGAATGVDNIDASEAAQKVIINDHVYILRNGQMYGVDGKAVK